MSITDSAQVELIDAAHTRIGTLTIFSTTPSSSPPDLINLPPHEARLKGEEPVQLLEGRTYEYQLQAPSGFRMRVESSGVIKRSRISGVHGEHGWITPGLYVGVLPMILEDVSGREIATATVEIRSSKLGYRDDYRVMLEEITEKSIDLLLRMHSPAQARLLSDPGNDPFSIQQRFSFIKSLLNSDVFRDAVNRVTELPHRRWESTQQVHDIRKGFRGEAKSLRQLRSARQRLSIPSSHPLSKKLLSLPQHITTYKYEETVDTPENRFVKYALSVFENFLTETEKKLAKFPPSQNRSLRNEVRQLKEEISRVLTRDFFKDISTPYLLPLGSPVLQRKGGYREILRAWLRFNMAAQLTWQGGDDVFSGGKRNIAKLYEYWLFFKLIDLVVSEFGLKPPSLSSLIERTDDGFGLKLKSGGNITPLQGEFSGYDRRLYVKFSYNKVFKGSDKPISFPNPGSWTRDMVPDFTISIWPEGFSERAAEVMELIVHIHFDAKYSVEAYTDVVGNTEEKSHKPETLLKMHSYRDAIRRTAGAYVLYPGLKGQYKMWRGFHEILPGLGAFSIRPDRANDRLQELSLFLKEVIRNLCNRASQGEQLSYHVNRINRRGTSYTLHAPLPEQDFVNQSRPIPPAEHLIMIAPVPTESHMNWITKHRSFIYRVGSRRGTARLTPSLLQAKHILLCPLPSTKLKTVSLWEIGLSGPRLISDEELKKTSYPTHYTSDSIFVIFDLRPDTRLDGYYWNSSFFASYYVSRKFRYPHVTTLDKLVAEYLTSDS